MDRRSRVTGSGDVSLVGKNQEMSQLVLQNLLSHFPFTYQEIEEFEAIELQKEAEQLRQYIERGCPMSLRHQAYLNQRSRYGVKACQLMNTPTFVPGSIDTENIAPPKSKTDTIDINEDPDPEDSQDTRKQTLKNVASKIGTGKGTQTNTSINDPQSRQSQCNHLHQNNSSLTPALDNSKRGGKSGGIGQRSDNSKSQSQGRLSTPSLNSMAESSIYYSMSPESVQSKPAPPSERKRTAWDWRPRCNITMYSKKRGDWHGLPALLDSGTSENWINEIIVERLGLRKTKGLVFEGMTFNGTKFSSGCIVRATWCPPARRNSYETEFWVLDEPEVPFDVLFGSNLLQTNKIPWSADGSEIDPALVMVQGKIDAREKNKISANEKRTEDIKTKLAGKSKPIPIDSKSQLSSKQSNERGSTGKAASTERRERGESRRPSTHGVGRQLDTALNQRSI